MGRQTTLQSAAPNHVAWVRTLFFSDLDDDSADKLAADA